jgi:aspartyl aminopeptidase
LTDRKDDLKRNAWMYLENRELKKVEQFSQGYLDFLSQAKTEREVVDYISDIAMMQGFQELDNTGSLKAGQKIVYNNKGKVCALAVIGAEPLEKGFNLVASHIDSPRLDPRPTRSMKPTDRFCLRPIITGNQEIPVAGYPSGPARGSC